MRPKGWPLRIHWIFIGSQGNPPVQADCLHGHFEAPHAPQGGSLRFIELHYAPHVYPGALKGCDGNPPRTVHFELNTWGCVVKSGEVNSLHEVKAIKLSKC